MFVAGLLVGDIRAPFKAEIDVFNDALSSLAEIVVFVALGLTVTISALPASRWAEGLLLALFVALVARPAALVPLLAPARLRPGERLFVIWGGLKGAVPILLAAFALAGGVPHAQKLYELIKGRTLALYEDKELRKHALNAVALETARGWRLAKEKSSSKIDGLAALSFACLDAIERRPHALLRPYEIHPEGRAISAGIMSRVF